MSTETVKTVAWYASVFGLRKASVDKQTIDNWIGSRDAAWAAARAIVESK